MNIKTAAWDQSCCFLIFSFSTCGQPSCLCRGSAKGCVCASSSSSWASSVVWIFYVFKGNEFLMTFLPSILNPLTKTDFLEEKYEPSVYFSCYVGQDIPPPNYGRKVCRTAFYNYLTFSMFATILGHGGWRQEGGRNWSGRGGDIDFGSRGGGRTLGFRRGEGGG